MNDTAPTVTTRIRRRPRRPGGKRNATMMSTIQDAYEGGKADVEELKGEIEEWQQNLEGNNMEHLPKYEEVSECLSGLEAGLDSLEGIDFPECLEGIDVTYTHDTRISSQSRSTRLSNALNGLHASKDAADNWLSENEALEADDAEGYDGDPDDFVTEEMAEERDTQRSAVEEFINEMDNAISELENVSFPGMY